MTEQNTMLPGDFNAGDHKPDEGFDVLPEGEYTVILTDAQVRDTQAGTGKYVAATMQVIDDGPFQNRKHWEMFNIQNPSQQAQQIGTAQFTALCCAIGHLQVRDLTKLLHQPFRVKLGIRVQQGGEYAGRKSNTVKSYMTKDGVAAKEAHRTLKAQAAQQAAPAAQAATPAVAQPAAQPATPSGEGGW